MKAAQMWLLANKRPLSSLTLQLTGNPGEEAWKGSDFMLSEGFIEGVRDRITLSCEGALLVSLHAMKPEEVWLKQMTCIGLVFSSLGFSP